MHDLTSPCCSPLRWVMSSFPLHRCELEEQRLLALGIPVDRSTQESDHTAKDKCSRRKHATFFKKCLLC